MKEHVLVCQPILYWPHDFWGIFAECLTELHTVRLLQRQWEENVRSKNEGSHENTCISFISYYPLIVSGIYTTHITKQLGAAQWSFVWESKAGFSIKHLMKTQMWFLSIAMRRCAAPVDSLLSNFQSEFWIPIIRNTIGLVSVCG